MNPNTKRNLSPYAFIAFPLAIIFIFTALPTLAGVILSFFEWSGGGMPQFIGLQNYQALADSKDFIYALQNTLVFTAATVPITVILAFLFAVALNAEWFKGRSLLRTVFFLPTIISIVAIGFIWRWLLDPSDAGLLNHYLTPFIESIITPTLNFVGGMFKNPELGEFGKIDFLGNSPLGLTTIIIVSIWRGLGFSIVLYLATLGSVPRAYYEAAAVDGAGPWKMIWHITWPTVRPMTFFLFITGTITALQVFDIILVMIGTNQQKYTDVLNLFLYREFTQNRLGFAAAIGVVLLVITAVITVCQMLFLRMQDAEATA